MDEESNGIEKQDIVGLTAQVKFDLPFCLYLDDGTYEVSRGTWTASIQLERVKQVHLDPRLGIAKSSAELKRDRYGRLRYSRVVVELPAQDVIEVELRHKVMIGDLETQDGFVDLSLTQDAIISGYSAVAYDEALAAVNRLIEVYRHVTDQFYVTRIPGEDIFNASVQWYFNGELFGGILQQGFGHGITMEPPPPTPETLQELQSWLDSTKEVPLPWELFYDAKDRLDRGDDRLAVIDARTALEVFLDQILLTYFTLPGHSMEEICKVLDIDANRRKIQDIEEALQRSAIDRKLGHALKEVIGLDIHDGNPELWKKWLGAKELREKGVHRGRMVGHDEAIEAVNCMGEILSKMREALGAAGWLKDEGGADEA